MKKTGRITLVSIAIIVELIQAMILGELLKREMIHLFVVVVICWFIGRQYDKMKYYTERMKTSEEYYKQLIETIPDAIFIYSQNVLLYINQAGHGYAWSSKQRGYFR